MKKHPLDHLLGLFGIHLCIGVFKPVVVSLDLQKPYLDLKILRAHGLAQIEVLDEKQPITSLAAHY